MTTIRRPMCALATILVTVFNPASITAAYADTIELVCSQPNYNPQLNVSIDLSAKTVASWISTINRSDVLTVSANITNDTVTWTTVAGAGTSRFTLDRKTEAMNIVRPEGQGDAWTCVRASPVF